MHAPSLTTYVLPSMRTPRFAAATCALPDGRVLVAGGVDAPGRGAVADPGGADARYRGLLAQCGRKTAVVEVFDPETNRWDRLPDLPEPVAGARACLAGDGKSCWVLGGAADSGGATDAVRALDLTTLAWRAGPPMARKRVAFGLAALPGRGVLACGGTVGYERCNRALTAEFHDFSTGAWVTVASPGCSSSGAVAHAERAGCALVVAGGHALVVGGVRVDGRGVPQSASLRGADGDARAARGAAGDEAALSDAAFASEHAHRAPGAPRLARADDVAALRLEPLGWVRAPLAGPGPPVTDAAVVAFGEAVLRVGGDAAAGAGHGTGGAAAACRVDAAAARPRLAPVAAAPLRELAYAAAGVAPLPRLRALAARHGWLDAADLALGRVPTPFDAVELRMRRHLAALGRRLEDTGAGDAAGLEARADKLARALRTVFETRVGYVRLARRPAPPEALDAFCALYLDDAWLARLLGDCGAP